MKVEFEDTFFDSLKTLNCHERWYFKLWFLFKDKIPAFFKNCWSFRKEIWEFRDWDRTYNLRLFKRSLELTAKRIKDGNEEDVSRGKKYYKMNRAIELLHNYIEDNYYELAEKELGVEYEYGFNFKEVDENEPSSPTKAYIMVDSDDPIKVANNEKIMDRAHKLEKDQWKELWSIIQGKGAFEDIEGESHQEYEKRSENYRDGSDMRGWWD
jgi:hypothetical protein